MIAPGFACQSATITIEFSTPAIATAFKSWLTANECDIWTAIDRGSGDGSAPEFDWNHGSRIPAPSTKESP